MEEKKKFDLPYAAWKERINKEKTCDRVTNNFFPDVRGEFI